jgi:maltose O-acetyltransferase
MLVPQEADMAKSEWEKMVSGELYRGDDPGILKRRLRAQGLCQAYLLTSPQEQENRTVILQELLGTSEEPTIIPPFWVDYGVNITVGKAFYANFGCTLLDVAPISIGDNVKLGPGVKIFTAGHPLDPEERNSGLEWGKAIRIADNVWVGGGAILCPGVSIGEGSTIGAGSVVTKDVPAGVVAGGNPAKIIRRL